MTVALFYATFALDGRAVVRGPDADPDEWIARCVTADGRWGFFLCYRDREQLRQLDAQGEAPARSLTGVGRVLQHRTRSVWRGGRRRTIDRTPHYGESA